jgi:hypothetical protein
MSSADEVVNLYDDDGNVIGYLVHDEIVVTRDDSFSPASLPPWVLAFEDPFVCSGMWTGVRYAK